MLSTGDRNLLPATSSSRFGVESIMVNWAPTLIAVWARGRPRVLKLN
jgi:hypothetical protein